ncbi:MAG: hypothetical protein ACJATT_004699 [Myxococcota bacterium]
MSSVPSMRNNDAKKWWMNEGPDADGESWLECAENRPAGCVQQTFEVAANQMTGTRLARTNGLPPAALSRVHSTLQSACRPSSAPPVPV